jgi:hypothetical protein
VLSRLRRDDRGSVLVIVAVAVPMFIAMAAVVLDIGNWYAHKRSLQGRVDAAAFAASVAYGYSFPACTSSVAAADQITTATKQYGGNGPGTTYNGSNGDGTAITVNAPNGASPCADGALYTDVRGSTTVPSLFSGFGIVPTIAANARVAVMQLKTATGIAPFAVANPGSTDCAKVDLVAADGTLMSTKTVTRDATPNFWSAAPVAFAMPAFTMPSDDVHANVTLGGDCADAARSITYTNVGFIQSWKDSDPFQAVTLTAAPGSDPGCTASFVPRNSPVPPSLAACTYNITAYPDTNDSNIAVDTVTADIPGVGSTTLCSTDLQNPPQGVLPGGGWKADGLVPFSSDSVSGDGTCTGGGPVTFHAGDGSATGGVVPVILSATTLDETPPNPIPAPPPTSWPAGPPLGPIKVQAVMAGNDTQVGPLGYVSLSSGGLGTSINHLTRVTDETVSLKLEPLVDGGACGYLGPGCVSTDPLYNGGPEVVLRPAGTDVHTLNGAVVCPPAGDDLATNVTAGCQASLQPGDALAGSADATSLGTAYGKRIWAPAGVCAPNNWPVPVVNGGVDQISLIPRGDPRLITVALTNMGAPFGPGNQHPIVAFAAFYVTGGADAAGCGEPAPPATALVSGGNEIWGHFLKFAEPSSTGGPTADVCTPPADSGDISACIATLVQ